MRVEHIQIYSAPGLPMGVEAPIGDAAFVLVHGPNASGKSTLGRALLAALGLRSPDSEVHAVVRWTRDDGTRQSATLHGGRAEGAWSDGPRSSDAEAWTLHLRDLLVADDTEFAHRMRNELYGGYDLSALAARYGKEVRHPRKLLNELNDAERRAQEVIQTQSELVDQEREREALEREIHEAEQAGARREHIERALRWHDAREALERAQDARALLPDVLATVGAGVPDRFDANESWISKVTDDLRARENEVARLRAELQPLVARIDGANLDDVALLRRRVEELASCDAARTQKTNELAEASGAAEELVRRLGAAAEGPAVDDEVVATLTDATRRLEQAEAEQRATRAALAALGEPVATGDPDPLRAAADTLTQWLQAHGTNEAQATVGPRWWTVAAWLAAVLVGVVAWAMDVAALALVAVLVALAPELWRRRSGGGGGPVATEPPAWAHPSVPPPPTWTVAAVTSHLLQVVADAAHQHAAREAATRDRTNREARSQDVTQAERRFDEAQQRRDQLCRQHGFSQAWPWDAALERATLRVELARARVRVAERRGALDEAERARTSAAEKLAQALHAVGRAHDFDESLARARAALDAAERDVQAATKLRGELEGIERDLGELERRRADLIDQRNGWLDALGLAHDQVDEARALLARLGAWQQASDSIAAAERDVRDYEQRVGDPTLLEMDRDALAALAAECQRRHESLSALQQQRADLDARVKQARAGHELADATQKIQEARSQLREQRDVLVEHAFAGALAEWVRGSLDRDAVPDTLRRAQRWFARFTRDAWELRIHDKGELYAAPAGTRDERPLAALSDATRVHLLLATRLARIEHVEAGTPLPLFLDEALSTTDPERLAAVADALFELARSGRQIFYATSSDADVAWWLAHARAHGDPPPTVVSTAHGTPRSWPDDAPAAPRVVPTIPDPLPGESPRAWYERAGVAVPALATDAGAWPAALLLHDALHDAAATLRSGIGTVGQLIARLERDADALPLSAAARTSAPWRAGVLERVLRAARIGRGRPLAWEDVESFRAITAAFRDRVHALWVKHGHAPAVFLREVRALPRFRSDTASQLERHLHAIDALDDRSPLSVDEIVHQAIDALPADGPSDVTREAAAFAEWICALVGIDAPSREADDLASAP